MGGDDHDAGLPHDLGQLLTRRHALGLFSASAASVAVGACDWLPPFAKATAEVIAKGADGRECVAHPTETAGPFPADGSNRAHGTLANVLADSGIVRRDMRMSLGREASSADGVPLHLTIALVSVGKTCAPLAGHALYLWHCDAAGKYSIYELADRSYLRAVGVSDAAGTFQFQTIVPGCYDGRYPHMHFEVYSSLERATSYRNRILTSQLALPADVCAATYRSHPAYRESIGNFARSPLDRDGIFRDNTPKQLAAQTVSMTGDSGAMGYRGMVTIGIADGAA